MDHLWIRSGTTKTSGMEPPKKSGNETASRPEWNHLWIRVWRLGSWTTSESGNQFSSELGQGTESGSGTTSESGGGTMSEAEVGTISTTRMNFNLSGAMEGNQVWRRWWGASDIPSQPAVASALQSNTSDLPSQTAVTSALWLLLHFKTVWKGLGKPSNAVDSSDVSPVLTLKMSS